MISDDRFALEISSFVPAIIDTFKMIPSRIYGKFIDFMIMHANISKTY